MARRDPTCILITGATRGLGAELALAYAKPGRVLALTGRTPATLERTAEACRAKGAQVLTHAADMLEEGSLTDWVAAVDREHPIDLLIANAGHFGGRPQNRPTEHLATAIHTLRTNLEGTIRTVDAVAPHMIERKRGHIAVISSLAAIQPLADAPAYSAAKAGLAAYCEALDEALSPLGIHISLILPGHIDTDQTRVHVGSLPGLMTAPKAARLIQSSLDRGKRLIIFPLRLALLIRLGKLSPRAVRHYFGRSFRFHVADEPEQR